MDKIKIMYAFRTIITQRRLTVNNFNILTAYSQKNFLSSKVQTENDNNEAEKKKKTTPIPKVTLISPDESILILTLSEAQKLSIRRNLKLVKLIDLDTKTQRPVYKLMTGHEYLAGDLKQRENKKNEKKSDNSLKSEKLLLINSRISEHDLESRIKKISKWLEKRHEVRVTISGDAENMEPCVSSNIWIVKILI